MDNTTQSQWNQTHLKEPKEIASIPLNETNPNYSFQLYPYKKLTKHLNILTKKELHIEAYLLYKMYYRNTYQHRNTYHFNALQQVYKSMKKLDGLQLIIFFKRIVQSFFDFKSNKQKNTAVTHIPNPSFLKYILIKITGIHHLFKHIINQCEHMYSAFELMIQKKDFMVFSFAALATCSRIKVLLNYYSDHLKQAFYLLNQIKDYYKKPLKLSKKLELINITKEEYEELKV